MTATRSASKELDLAERCDARGEHDEAVNALARATRLGDAEAATRLGKRLIVGTTAPFLPKEGTGFLIEALNAGGAEAAARLAVLAAAGVYVSHSLADALALLVRAAERDWRPAQSQLLALTPDRALADVVSKSTGRVSSWHEIAGTIDIESWRTAPEKRDLNESPLISSVADLVPGPVCDWLIGRSAGRLERALVYDAVGGSDYASEVRTNKWAQFDLMSCELTHVLVQYRMAAVCGIPLHNMEATAILHYSVGEQISNHYDFVDPGLPNYEQELEKNGQRIMTFLVYLNDDYEGGETEFPELGISHAGRRGEGLFFVNALENGGPDLRTLHAGRPPTRGEKWVISQFCRDRRVFGFEALPAKRA